MKSKMPSDKAPPGYRLTARGWTGSLYRQLVNATDADQCVMIIEKTIDKIIQEAYKRGYDDGWGACEVSGAPQVSRSS
jgi:hypothetical protein